MIGLKYLSLLGNAYVKKKCSDFAKKYQVNNENNFPRTTFSVDADTHIEAMNQAEQTILEGTSKWSCKIAITGIKPFHENPTFFNHLSLKLSNYVELFLQ